MLSEQYQEMLSCMGPSDNVQKLAELCGRNFLFLTHALEFWVKEGNVLNVPTNVEKIYRVNLIRIFGKTENMFNNMRTIFEILCASLGSVSESVLFDVLNEKGSHQHIYFSRLLSNELSHFVQKSSGEITFTNRRYADFFSKQDNVENDFYIIQQTGHKLLAQSWVKYIEKFSSKTTKNMPIDIFRHIASSRKHTSAKNN